MLILKIHALVLLLFIQLSAFGQTREEIFETAENFLYQTKVNENSDLLRIQMELWDRNKFTLALTSDSDKIAFWLNIYNAIVQEELVKSPELYDKRNRFFKTKLIDIAGISLSPDEIEHGILRKSSIKLSLGYLNKLFPRKVEKEWRVDKLDPRIHFALNCGAASCPAINWYTSSELDSQLTLATEVYLSQTIKLNIETKTIYIPKLFSWFRGDFKGKKGIIEFVRTYYKKDISAIKDIEFLPYYWELQLKTYSR